MTFQRLLATIALAACSLAALALPTVDAVQAEVQRGNYAQAETMMQEVVAAKPTSARAHYVYAEILAHNRRFELAANEAARARQIDPAIGFTDAAKFAALEQLLERERHAVRPTTGSNAPAVATARAMPQPEQSSGLPIWVWGFGFAGIAAIVWVVVSRRQQAAATTRMTAGAMAGAAPGGGYGPGAVPGYAPGYGQPAPSGGSGLMGVGLAAAGGLAAGMLAERMLHGGHDAGGAMSAPAAAGGLVPGMFDDSPVDDGAARELEQRPIDFGRGDGWGDDGGSSGDGGDVASDDGW